MSTIQIPDKLKNTTYKFILLLISLIISFAIVEISLRVFYPKYEYAAESKFAGSMNRIMIRNKNSHYERTHPDSGLSHLVYYNNLALRQNRNFYKEDFKSAINIGFFGDSFTENLRLPSQYSFTEPLDYLLNTRASKFNVLNFGVDAYGTDQSFLTYLDFEHSKDLDYVFYIFCINDLRNIYENNLFSMNKEQGLIQNQVHASPWWVRSIRTFHITYLVIDALQKLRITSDRILDRPDFRDYFKHERSKRFHDQLAEFIQQDFIHGRKTEDLNKIMAIFKSLLHEWKQAVEKNGGKFYVVLLPRLDEHNAKHVFSEEFDVLDLYEKFDNNIDNYNYHDWRFTNDRHWNEGANQLTATYLYRLIEDDLKLSLISTDMLKEELYTYYASFDGWMPNNSFTKKIFVTQKKRQAIKSKYRDVEIENIRY